jgi:hypothetical protein
MAKKIFACNGTRITIREQSSLSPVRSTKDGCAADLTVYPVDIKLFQP